MYEAKTIKKIADKKSLRKFIENIEPSFIMVSITIPFGSLYLQLQ